MRDLFDPPGDGVSVLRQPMGASDFVDGAALHLRRRAARATDYALHHFCVEHDREQILPLLRQALALNPRAEDRRDALESARLDEDQPSRSSAAGSSTTRAIYTAYARYFVKFLQA